MANFPSQVAWLTRVQWALAGAMALAGVAFGLTVYRPQSLRLADLDAQIDSHRRELQANQDQTSILPSVAADVERLRARLDKVKVLPRQQELPQFIKDVAQLGDQASLKKFEMTRGMPARGERLNELPVHLTFEGDFVSVFSFLRHTEDLQRLTRVPAIEVHAKDKAGQVKVQLTMNIYFSADEQ